MDVFSTVCGIVGIVDVLTRSIVKLHDISKMLQSANITLVALIGELTATRTALNQLRDCVERHRDGDQHYTMVSLDRLKPCSALPEGSGLLDHQVNIRSGADSSFLPSKLPITNVCLDYGA